MSNRSHYQNLGLSQDAKPEAIVDAHAALTKKCRAELSPNADASRYLTAIDTALAVLSDPQQRAAYDRQLLEGERPTAPPVKAAAASQVAAAKNKAKTVGSIASEVASKAAESPIGLQEAQKKSLQPPPAWRGSPIQNLLQCLMHRQPPSCPHRQSAEQQWQKPHRSLPPSLLMQ
jgi:DnaJ-class molecular chaperone